MVPSYFLGLTRSRLALCRKDCEFCLRIGTACYYNEGQLCPSFANPHYAAFLKSSFTFCNIGGGGVGVGGGGGVHPSISARSAGLYGSLLLRAFTYQRHTHRTAG